MNNIFLVLGVLFFALAAFTLLVEQERVGFVFLFGGITMLFLSRRRTARNSSSEEAPS
ncbi:MAG: hypothetical protein ABJO41_09915 [Erythrobacter sp.]